jgi:hypothetical protein
VDPAIVTAAFAVPEVGGVVPAPVAFGNRFSVVKVTGRRPAETTPIEQARDGIRRRIWRERRQAAIDAFVAELRTRAHVTSNGDRVRAIRLDEAPATLGDTDHHGDEGPEIASPSTMSASAMSAPSMTSMEP